MFEPVQVDGETRLMPAVHPRLCKTPASSRWAGPDLGQHTDEVLQDWLGVDDSTMTEWREKKLV